MFSCFFLYFKKFSAYYVRVYKKNEIFIWGDAWFYNVHTFFSPSHPIAVLNECRRLDWHNFPKTSSHTKKKICCCQIAPLNSQLNSLIIIVVVVVCWEHFAPFIFLRENIFFCSRQIKKENLSSERTRRKSNFE